MASLRQWQTEVGDWSIRTFGPGERLEAHLEHLRRELDEVRATPTAEEVADCLILLLGLSQRLGIDLEGALRQKHQKNQVRQWGPPDALGVIEHVRGEEG